MVLLTTKINKGSVVGFALAKVYCLYMYNVIYCFGTIFKSPLGLLVFLTCAYGNACRLVNGDEICVERKGMLPQAVNFIITASWCIRVEVLIFVFLIVCTFHAAARTTDGFVRHSLLGYPEFDQQASLRYELKTNSSWTIIHILELSCIMWQLLCRYFTRNVEYWYTQILIRGESTAEVRSPNAAFFGHSSRTFT